MNKFIIIFLITVFFSCSTNENKQFKENGISVDKSSEDMINRQIVIVDLDSLNASNLKNIKFLEHKAIQRLEEIDSLNVTSNVVSILKSFYRIKAKSEYQSDIFLNKLKIYCNDSLIFTRDSVFSVGVFEFCKRDSLLSFPIINNQNQDNFSTNSDLFLFNLKTKKLIAVKKSLTNTVNGFFSTDDNSIYYLNNNHLINFNYFNQVEKTVLEFSNSDYTILHIQELRPLEFKVVYTKDLASGELLEVIIKLN